MPSVIPRGITSYNVRTGNHLHHEKSKSPRNNEIITWRSPRNHGNYNMGTATNLHHEKIIMWQHTNLSMWHHYTSRTTVNMSGYIFFNCEYNVLICKTHQYAISPKFLAHHLLQEHNLEVTVRQEIVSYASQFTAAEATQLTYSLSKVIPIPYLNTITGYQCQYENCNKILGTLQSVQRHCRLNHGWKAKNGDSWVETRAQTFFQGNDRRYEN